MIELPASQYKEGTKLHKSMCTGEIHQQFSSMAIYGSKIFKMST